MNDGSTNPTPWWQPALFAAVAGGMGWGIRGQYGHETGAMVAGVLVSSVLVLLLGSRLPARQAIRALAWGTVAMGFGGSMTYGQTVGLTHDAPLIGHWGALGWGLLGLAVKGGVWIGFAGVFLGMGFGGKRYRSHEIFALMLAMLGAYFIGLALLNGPYYPAAKVLPPIYFSDDWRWEPDGDLSPRRENWGGLWFALSSAIIYAGFWRKDRLARNMAAWGILGGAMGFPLGQCLQAFHAWNPEVFQGGVWANLDPYMNWWNMMEIAFGAVMGGTLGLGLWLNRGRIRALEDSDACDVPAPVEGILLAAHLVLLGAVEFLSIRTVDALYDLGLIMGIIPMAMIAGGRAWPYLQVLPIVLMPIAGKTLRNLGYENEAISLAAGWSVYAIAPMIVAVLASLAFARADRGRETRTLYAGRLLLFSASMFFLLNFAIFRFPWPWQGWTGRTPSGIIFAVCALGLAGLAWTRIRREAV